MSICILWKSGEMEHKQLLETKLRKFLNLLLSYEILF